MTYRNFRDAAGQEWEVWEVNPGTLDRRTLGRRAENPGSLDERRASGDRRATRGRVAALAGSGREHGWLCFERGGEKRRLSPIPADWTRCDSRQLEAYCREATVAQRPRSTEQNAVGS